MMFFLIFNSVSISFKKFSQEEQKILVFSNSDKCFKNICLNGLQQPFAFKLNSEIILK